MSDSYKIAAKVVPSERQLKWQEVEFYAFCHFGMNTFTGKEWGDGQTPPEVFHPTDFDAEQWAKAVKSAGMRGLILTCKHHDGFCLWPSAYTEYSVKNSPFRDGQGDVVREVADACKKYGLKFGVYLSPWDRHEPTYGQGEPYNTYYKNQLRELLTNYGELFCIWLDGACGEGKNGKKQKYDWQSYYAVMRELQPNAAICISGPDVRWIGNEAGVCRKAEWSVVPSWLSINEYVAEHSQKADDKKFAKTHNAMVLDLGSRKAIANETDFIWYPAEVDVSIRPGWFYHAAEDGKVKSLDKLFKIYLNSVGGNASLLLNIPPDTTGRIPQVDALTLDAFGRMLGREFPVDLLQGARASATSELDSEHGASSVLEDNGSFWQSALDEECPELVLDFGMETAFDSLILQENIRTGQQIEAFDIAVQKGNRWKRIGKYTIIGYKRICRFKTTYRTRKIRIRIRSHRGMATILRVFAYKRNELV
ncbi:MAG: alpha-L-fucosidase [Lachnospiraceae bacterium]